MDEIEYTPEKILMFFTCPCKGFMAVEKEHFFKEIKCPYCEQVYKINLEILMNRE